MSKPNKIWRIKKGDFNRALLTDTLPFEIPISISNEGLYQRVRRQKSTSRIENIVFDIIIRKHLKNKPANYTIPFQYKIKMDDSGLRRLSLIHPFAQIGLCEIYAKWHSLIIYYCGQSKSTLRAPKKQTSAFYLSNVWQDLSKYRSGSVEIEQNDMSRKHVPSFFAYRGYDRLYKFFESNEFKKLELRYSSWISLDVSKCFDSIYTHSLAWATKGKQFAKQNLAELPSFAADFDKAVRFSNYGETNGIPIGPEVSRIFAEILFQKIDQEIIAAADLVYSHQFGVHYEIRRYVDDIYIFAVTKEVALQIQEIVEQKLLNFNLHLNKNKTVPSMRPFISERSVIALRCKALVSEYIELVIESTEGTAYAPHPSVSLTKAKDRFIMDVKILCKQLNVGYFDISNIIISMINERVKRVAATKPRDVQQSLSLRYKELLINFTQIILLYFRLAPTVTSSYRVSLSLILIVRFLRRSFPECVDEVSTIIHLESLEILTNAKNTPQRDSQVIDLALINFTLALRELGTKFLLPDRILRPLFLEKADSSTIFEISSLLFYIRDELEYEKLRNECVSILDKKFKACANPTECTETLILFLDCIACPFISTAMRKEWLKLLLAFAQQRFGECDLDEFLGQGARLDWFSNWHNLDLLNSLEKRELRRIY